MPGFKTPTPTCRWLGSPIPDSGTSRMVDGVDWEKDQPMIKFLKKHIPDRFAIIPEKHPRGRGVGGYVPRRTRAGGFSAHSQGRAADIYLDAFDDLQKYLGDELFSMFVDNATDLGVEHIIWNRQIWSAEKGGPRSYTNAANGPHTNHIHVAFSELGSQLQPVQLLNLLDEIKAKFEFRAFTLAVSAIIASTYDHLTSSLR